MFDNVNNDNLTFQTQITVTNVNGSKDVVVDLYAHIIDNEHQYINFSANIINKDIYKKNMESIKLKIAEFKEEVNGKIEALGLIII